MVRSPTGNKLCFQVSPQCFFEDLSGNIRKHYEEIDDSLVWTGFLSWLLDIEQDLPDEGWLTLSCDLDNIEYEPKYNMTTMEPHTSKQDSSPHNSTWVLEMFELSLAVPINDEEAIPITQQVGRNG